VEEGEVQEYQDSRGVECEYDSCFFDIWHGDGVNTKADGFTSAKKASEDALETQLAPILHREGE
jgi:UDP-2,3-diacylglucosamine pyrophosphatase LpxH